MLKDRMCDDAGWVNPTWKKNPIVVLVNIKISLQSK
jgi:hypothetical protein